MVDLTEAGYVTRTSVLMLSRGFRTAHRRLREHRSRGHVRSGCGRSGCA